LPQVGQRLELHGWTVEVVDLDGRRIDKLLVGRTGSPNSTVARAIKVPKQKSSRDQRLRLSSVHDESYRALAR
jgi:hypothetical protein